jgi:dTDP-4-amino-4,6-dideoxygalactose transaminase
MIQTFSSSIRRKEMEAVLTCMVNETIGPGDMNKRLVSEAKEFFGVDGAVAVRSPAIALKYALKCYDFEPNSKIILSPLAPMWQMLTVEECGYVPVFPDVDGQTGVVTIEAVRDAVQDGARGIVLYAPFGRLADAFSMMELGLAVIEDLSESTGGFFYKGRSEEGGFEEKVLAGAVSPYTIVGLDENDIITAGGGALLLARNRREYAPLKSQIEQADFTDILPDINCALGFVQIREFQKNQEICKKMEKVFSESLLRTSHSRLQQMPIGDSRYVENSVYSFPIVIESSLQTVKDFAKKKDVQIAMAFENRIIERKSLPDCKNAKSLYLRTILFPLYSRLSEKNIEKISKVLQYLP